MEHELRVRAEPKWTGRTHDWSTAEHPLAKQCTRCHVPMVGNSNTIDWRNGDVLAMLWSREDCAR